jgi:hypothetical protein
MRDKKLRRDSEARDLNLSREERTEIRDIKRQGEEMEHKKMAVNTGGEKRQQRGRAGREVGQEARS